MSTIWYIDSALIIISIITLILSFFTTSRIINELDLGKLKRRWNIIRLLVCLFIAGYIGYWIFLPHDVQNDSLIVSFMFIIGAVFVFTICWLVLQTTRDIKRVANRVTVYY